MTFLRNSRYLIDDRIDDDFYKWRVFFSLLFPYNIAGVFSVATHIFERRATLLGQRSYVPNGDNKRSSVSSVGESFAGIKTKQSDGNANASVRTVYETARRPWITKRAMAVHYPLSDAVPTAVSTSPCAWCSKMTTRYVSTPIVDRQN